MLLALLPGLRHLRAPLFSGLAWIAIAWLVWARHLPSTDQATGVLAQVYGLAKTFGPAVVLGAIAVGAYGLGELWDFLRMGVWHAPTKRLPWLRIPIGVLVRFDDDRHITDYLKPHGALRELLPYLGVRQPDAYDAAIVAQLREPTSTDLDQGVVHLLATRPELHAEYDRLRAESRLRESLTVPVTLLIPVGVWAFTHAWFPVTVGIVAGVLVGIALAKSARHQLYRSRSVLLTAVLAGHITAPVLSETAREMFGAT